MANVSSNWKESLFNEIYKTYTRMDTAHEESYSTKEKEIGLIHPLLGTGMLLRNNGAIEAFADYNLGFKIDPDNNTLSIYAPTIALHTNEIVHSNYENKTYFSKEVKEILEYVDA